MVINDEVLIILKESGWFEGRTIDISELESSLENIGYEVFEPVKQFLKEFGMLKIIDENGRTHSTSEIITPYFKNGKYKEIEKYAGEKLVPVGEVYEGNLLMFVSETGKIYHETGKLGDSGLEAWKRLFSGIGAISWDKLK